MSAVGRRLSSLVSNTTLTECLQNVQYLLIRRELRVNRLNNINVEAAKPVSSPETHLDSAAATV